MSPSRRRWLASIAGMAAGLSRPAARCVSAVADEDSLPIVDTHQHLWSLPRQRLAWLNGAPAVLRRSYTIDDYRDATAGLNVVQAVYMEVDVEPEQHLDEVETIVDLCRAGRSVTRAAVVGGRPASAGFETYVKRLGRDPEVKGVRQVLHGGTTPPGYCLGREFVRGIQQLGESGLRFDLCPRPAELVDADRLVAQCPRTRFVLDHCGNADPAAFRPRRDATRPTHDPDAWRRDLARLAKRENVVCKISGIVARADAADGPEELAPIVNHCLDSFGPDRVMFGGDWPVCLLGRSYRGWVETLRAIVSNRPLAERRKLWHDNAVAFYQIGG